MVIIRTGVGYGYGVPMLLLLAMICLGVDADLAYRANAIHPDYPGQCYFEELKQAIPKHQSYKPINREGFCNSIHCRPDYVLEIEYCGRHNLVPSKNCKIYSDMRRTFPNCCPQLLCKDTDTNII
ncbi:hypothetical protein KR215_002147 [Drosophila sulfurigaster]|uniref:Uncharacterized protein LOC117575138 n=1 Tax=Drosophila albomicans TaxID=7291 RepID=A0A6P8XPZ9_DROAB|nr:uncharacterized protein LOC117575138 [Drosophila albomicans]XP_060664959.1 uncharacterized protein LOC132797302 [Drosophila nasuta]XP_062140906.1 uncharacterized protein LOC133849071 [Drosophila sulfurigaster albostrigata]KAH8411327.1 hypothetical protein KR215_002147 [Drosophila sulfurigaster]